MKDKIDGLTADLREALTEANHKQRQLDRELMHIQTLQQEITRSKREVTLMGVNLESAKFKQRQAEEKLMQTQFAFNEQAGALRDTQQKSNTQLQQIDDLNAKIKSLQSDLKLKMRMIEVQ